MDASREQRGIYFIPDDDLDLEEIMKLLEGIEFKDTPFFDVFSNVLQCPLGQFTCVPALQF